MKKGKILGIALTLLAIVGLSSLFYFTKDTAYANGVIFEGESYTVQLETALTKDSVTNGTVTVTDAAGKVVQAKLKLDDTAKMLTVENLKAGQYKVVIKKNAYAKATKLISEQSIPLDVIQKVSALKTEADLKAYFKAYIAAENAMYQGREEEMAQESFGVATENKSSDKASGGQNYSSTNNQVEGIEEGDISITDGKNIYTIVDNKIMIVDAKSLKMVKRLTVGKDIYPTHLMLHNELLIVGYTTYVQTQREDYFDSKSISKVAFYDVKDAANPVLVREVGQDGDITNIRKLGNYLYVVSSKTPNYWMLTENPDVELRPATYDGGKEKLIPVDQIKLLPESNQPSYLIVSAIDVSNVKSNEWKTASFLGNSGQMYMSESAIYIASMNYRFWPVVDTMIDTTESSIVPVQSENETTIYKIAIDKTNISMATEGKVKGSVLNQFSMDEHNGYIRIATTEGNAWGAEANSKNHLFILDGNLKQVGAVHDLAPGERIYSARFIGDKAYLVTFKETDPLFVIDTKNPKAPKVLGELKIPGFSNYLHPIDENHLLGIGYDTEVRMEEGSKEPIVLTKGMKLSLFDVSDLKNPKEKQAVVIGGRGTYSPVQYDHKALFRDPRNNFYGFPVTVYSETDEQDRLKYEGTGAQIYKVTASGIDLVANLLEQARPGEQYEDAYNAVQRLLYVEDELYAVSRSKVTSYNGKTFKKQQTIGF
ncbi:beta-propeller domain-containing protein [Solibacillus sp. MA9]|uniref:Beta-propeller domain-containing protein n=1 Tax=Solibacillus palustris TaxID=2908203 RepID=A0ABS9U7Q1_9BACL|nr:beta-propeller domain-containing protein [Solibacillus sp. MA9]MCH7320361.1 beta-propeller domain-containing protein [Solibacillus sp. MA9]